MDPFEEHRQATATSAETVAVVEEVTEEDAISSASYPSSESELEEEIMALLLRI